VKKYVSGKIDGLTEDEYIEAFRRGCALVVTIGDEAVNPLEVNACITEDCNGELKDATYLADGRYHHRWSCYLRYDIIELLKCDVIVMLPNWPTSRGATFERHIAEQCDMPVEYISHDYKEIRSYA